MPPNTLPVPPPPQTFATVTGTPAYTTPASGITWATVGTFASPPLAPRRAPRRAAGIDSLDLEAFDTRAKSKFTWALWSNMWGKIAEAHEKRVYLIPDEPPITVTPTVPEPVVATTASRVSRYTNYYEATPFYIDDAPF